MKYLHTMIRVANLDQSLDFFVNKLGFVEQRRYENDKGRFTLVFVAAPESPDAPVELTYNWDPEVYGGGRNFGHLALGVDNIYDTCAKLQKAGITINRPPRDGNMAFVRTPDGISIELLQKGEALPVAEPWASMGNTGSW
jgi:lactoylglutathione lyase